MMLDISHLTVRIPLNPERTGRSGHPGHFGGSVRSQRTKPQHIVHAVTDVSLSVDAGQLLAIVGESGCGKSMIAQTICGVLPPAAETSGSVLFRGETELNVGLAERDPSIAGNEIALIPQSAATFLTPVRTVGSQLDETIAVLQSKRSASELLAAAGLDDGVLKLYPHELSGGMAQRCAIAFALVGDPSLIVADEPTASLDPQRTSAMFRALRQLADDGAAVILITHDISDLVDEQIADDVAVMYASRIVEHSPTALTNPEHDYTRDLLAALPEFGMHPMPGQPPSLIDLPEEYSYATRRAQR